MPLHPDFTAEFKKAFNARSANADDVAKALGVSRQTVYNWINGDARPDQKRAVNAARYFRLPDSQFWIEDLPAASSAAWSRIPRFGISSGIMSAPSESRKSV